MGPKKRRLRIATADGPIVVPVPEDATVADACAATEERLRGSGQLGKRRIHTLLLPDGGKLCAADCLADVVEDGEELQPVFDEGGAGAASEPGAGAAADGAPRAEEEGEGGEAKRRKLEHGAGQDGAAARSPRGRGGESASPPAASVGAPPSSPSSSPPSSPPPPPPSSPRDGEEGSGEESEEGSEDESEEGSEDENGNAAELVELRLQVRKGGAETEETVRVRPDAVDLTAHTGLVALPEELRACAGRVRALRVASDQLEALPAWLGELTGLTELRVGGWFDADEKKWHDCPLRALPAEVGRLTGLETLDLTGCSGLAALPDGLGALTRLETLDLYGCSGLTALPAGLGALTRLERLELFGCAALHTPPPRVVLAGTGAVLAFLRDLRGGAAPCYLVKVVLLGDQRAGKSSLADSLVRGRPATRPADDRTVGIEVRRWPLGAGPGGAAGAVGGGAEEHGTWARDQALEGGRRVKVETAFTTSAKFGRRATELPSGTTGTVALVAGHFASIVFKGLGLCFVLPDDYGKLLVDTGDDRTEDLVAHIYDAAGHRVYRASHGAFMSPEALFLHVVRSDAPAGEAAAAVLAWLEAVQQEAPGAVMGVVFTHADLLADDAERDRRQHAVVARVQAEVQRQVRAVDEAMRRAEAEGAFEVDAAWREKQARRDKELDTLDRALAAWQETGAHRADSTAIGTVADALARLSTLHHEMHELEARLPPADQGARNVDQQRLQRLREQRVRRPRLLFSYGVSSKTGHGLAGLRRGLAALMQDQRLFPHVGMKVPLSYAMLERLAQEGRVQADPGPNAAKPPERAAWEHAVTEYVEKTVSAGLRALCAQPYASLRDLEREAAGAGLDAEQLLRALQFLHATGSVLHYGAGARQHSPQLQGVVFLQPQFIIDAIKYVIREASGEDVNDELRALDAQIRGTASQHDLDLLLERGELTRSLLAELWAKFKFKAQDERLMLELMKGFRLLRELGSPGDGERFVVPAMLPTTSLPPEFLAPDWWRPSKADAAARIEEDGAHRPAAVRVMYEVLGGQLPFGFMGELQVSLAQSDEAGDADLQQHFAPERSVEAERVGGSVLCERRGNAKEWDVLSHHHGSRPAHASGAGAASGSGEASAPALRLMAWVELLDARAPAATEWRLFQHVRAQIQDAAAKVPGLTLREMACHVDGGGALAKPFDLSRLLRRSQEYIGFEVGGGASTDVKRRHVLPCEDAPAVLQLVPSQAAHERDEVSGWPAGAESAQPVASQRRLPVIEGFFCKKNTDKTKLQSEIEALKSTDAVDNNEQLKKLESMVEESVEAIDVHQEAQELMTMFTDVRASFVVRVHPQPCFKHFTDSMQSARARNVRLLHLAGHNNTKCEFSWLKASAGSTEYEAIPIDKLIGILKTEAAGANGGTIECVVLNACETEEMGKKLRSAGVPHIVCWRSKVRDDTARAFARDFYASLNQQDPERDYARAFQHAVARMAAGSGGKKHLGKKYLAAGALDYVCLLSEHGNEFPDTGHIL